MKNTKIFSLFLVLGIISANQSVQSEEQSSWDRLIKTVPLSMIENMPELFEDIKNNFGVANLGHNSLGLACALGNMTFCYKGYFGTFSVKDSYYSKIRKDGYEVVIQYFIDNGCNVDEKYDFSILLPGSDFDFSSYKNIFGSLFAIAFIFDEAMIHALINKGFKIDKKDQLEILLFFAKDGKELLPIRCEYEDSLDWNNDRANYDSLVTFFKYCDQAVQKEFLVKQPEFKQIIK